MKCIWLMCGLSKMASFQCGGSALIWFLWSGRKRLIFSVRIEISSTFALGHRKWLDIRMGIKIDFISMVGSKLTWFLRAGSKLTSFKRRDRSWFVFCAAVKIDFGFVWWPFLIMDRNWLGFCVRAENDLFLVWGSIDSVSYGWSKSTWFLYAGRKSPGFSVSIELDFIYALMVDFDLISLWGVEVDFMQA